MIPGDIVTLAITVKDAETGKTVLNKTVNLAENAKASAGLVPASGNTKLYLIEWEIAGKKYFNHYLAYNPPLQLDQYINWLTLLK